MRSRCIVAVLVVPQIAFPAADNLLKLEGNWWHVVVVALILALINSYVKPILKALSFPITLLTMGLFAFVLNALLLLLVAFLAEHARHRLHDRRLPAELHRGLVRGRAARLDRDQHRVDRARACSTGAGASSPDGLDASGRADDRRRSIRSRGSRRPARRGARDSARPSRSPTRRRSRPRPSAVRAAFPDPWLRAFSVKANDVAGDRRPRRGARLRRERRLAGRVGGGSAGRRCRTTRITLEGVGKTDADLRAACRAAADGAPLRWIAIESLDEADALVRIARADRSGAAARDWTCCSG